MADNILYCILDGHIPLEEVLSWISSKEGLELEEKHGCSRSDFVQYILNFLHQGTARNSPPLNGSQHGNRFSSKINQNEAKGGLAIACKKEHIQHVKFQDSASGGGCTNNPRVKSGSSICPKNESCQTVTSVDCCILSPQSDPFNGLQRKFSPPKTTQKNSQDSNFMVTSPFSCGMTPDGSPQFSPQKHFQTPKCSEIRYVGLATSTPDSGGRNSHKSGGFCLGDFIVKDGKSHSKKRLNLSPPKSPADCQGTNVDEANLNNSNKKKHRRRINPTKLSEEKVSASFSDKQPFVSLNQNSPFNESSNMEPSGASRSYTEERNLLKQERMKHQGDQVISQTSLVSLTPVSKFTFPKYTIADPKKVTYQDELFRLSSIYCSILDANLVPNLMTELYFILQLLVIQDNHLESVQDVLSTEVDTAFKNLTMDKKLGSGEGELESDNMNMADLIQNPTTLFKPRGQFRSILMFSSVHNCVYFALKVLLHLKDVLGCLDRITLKLMLENERIADFAPELTECLATLYATATNTTGLGQFTRDSVVNSNVAFQSETDNSSNFPSAQAFSSFRKQRDGFYELIRIWEANHMSPGWCFSTALGSRLRSILQLCNDPTNYMHLARLFRLQLIATGHGESSVFDEEGPEDSALQECLRGVDPDKLNRLRERFVTPRTSAGPRPPPSFPGLQEFYRDFIVCAHNPAFLQHLQDGLVSHLLELNQTSFVASDMEESDLRVDEVMRHEYMSSVCTMQLLAKFLGFVVFYPYYRPEVKPSEKILDTEIALRSKVLPPIDALLCVAEAYKNHRLIVTVPWVVKYLGMMDVVSSALPVFQATLRLLLYIYTSLCHKSSKFPNHVGITEDTYILPDFSILLLRLSLGWLFEASSIHDNVFNSLCCTLDDHDLLGISDLWSTAASDLELSALENSANASLATNANPPVDVLNLVDGQVLYTFCPYLLELRAPLTSAPVTRSTPRNSVRHITPVSTSFTASSPSSTTKQLELQLEDSFFHNLPASVHRTVEFVEERVTSLCVKHICNVWLRGLKEQGILKLRQKIEISWDDLDTEQDSMLKEVQTIVDEVSRELKLKCRSGINEVCFAKCKGALLSLLSEESLSPAVCEICVAIATRTCVERVVLWMQTHATLSNYGKDLQSEIDKALKNRDRLEMLTLAKTSHIAPGASASWAHNDLAPSPFEVLQALKLLVCNTLDGQDTTRENIEGILEKIKLTVTERQDVVPAAERVLALLSVDLVVALACHFPSMLDSTLLNQMVNLWKLDALRPVEDGLARLVCPRNMLLLAQSHHPPRVVWEKLADVVVAVLKAELVTPDLVENQCLAIMQQEWPQNILRCFSMCMNEVVRQYQKQKNVDYKFVLLLEWLAETMAQIEYFPDL